MPERRLAEVVAETLEGVFATVDDVRRAILAAHRTEGATAPVPLTADTIESLGPKFRALLLRPDQIAVGLGAIFEPASLSPPHPRLEWWHHQGDRGRTARLVADLRPGSLDFYDYPRLEWFAGPRATGRRHIVGPYVDARGTDEYLLTLTVPVLSGDTFLGVAGADVSMSGFETLVLDDLPGDAEAVVLNGDGRVVVSTTSRWLVGSMVRDTSGLATHPLDGLPWRVATPA